MLVYIVVQQLSVLCQKLACKIFLDQNSNEIPILPHLAIMGQNGHFVFVVRLEIDLELNCTRLTRLSI